MADPLLPSGSSPASYRTENQELSGDELRELIDVLRTPLQGRSVLVPFGSQAFFEGTLDPKNVLSGRRSEGGLGRTQQEEKAHLDGDGERVEYVVLRTPSRDIKNEQFTEQKLTRQQARYLLQSECDVLTRTKRRQPQAAGTVPSPQAESTTAPSSGDNKTEKTLATFPSSSSGQKTHPPTPGGDEQFFFEIREEIDVNGKEIRSEAVNVSRQLEFLESESSSGDQKPVLSNNNIVKLVSDDHGEEHTFTGEDHPPRQKRVLSDAEYDELSARLDELARLEEQAEKSKATNAASRERLQGGGWSSGFFNKPIIPKASQKVPVGAGSDKRTKKVIPPMSKEVESNPVPLTGFVESTEMASASRRVGFNPQANQVREIPRVGERSASEIRKKPSPSQLSLLATSQRNPSEGETGFSSSVTGAVRERSKPSKKKPSGGTAALPGTSTMDPSMPPRRLSRFAQERLEQQQQQQQQQQNHPPLR